MSTGKRIPALDGLRGIAALMVVLDHTAKEYFPLGSMGVSLFFALSGFLIGGILMDTAGSPGWVRRFYVRRTLRIWPLYFLVVSLVALFQPMNGLPLWPIWTFWADLAIPLADYHHSFEYPFTIWILWSICVEEHAYLVLPPLIRYLQRRQLAVGLGFVALLCILIRSMVWEETRCYYMTYMPTICRLDSICIGVVAAWVLRYRREWIPVLLLAGLFVLGIAVGTVNQAPFWQWIPLDLFGPFVLQAVGAAVLILGLVDGRLSIVDRVLSLRPLQYLGTVSYGLYVIHPCVLAILTIWLARHHVARPSPMGMFALLTGLTLILASLSWRFFESPLLNLSRSSAPQLQPEAVPAAET